MEENKIEDVKTMPVTKEAEAARMDVEATRGETFVTPRVDIYETDDELVLTADVPGTTKEGVEVGLEDGVLEITAHRKAESPGSEPDYAEYRPASFYRAFSVSDAVDAEKIDASLADGVLTLTLPKAPKAKPRKIEVRGG